MATNSLKSTMVALFVFALVLSPMVPCEAARPSHPRGDHNQLQNQQKHFRFVVLDSSQSAWLISVSCRSPSNRWTHFLSCLCLLHTSSARRVLWMLRYTSWSLKLHLVYLSGACQLYTTQASWIIINTKCLCMNKRYICQTRKDCFSFHNYVVQVIIGNKETV